jgi:hypothetical protein
MRAQTETDRAAVDSQNELIVSLPAENFKTLLAKLADDNWKPGPDVVFYVEVLYRSHLEVKHCLTIYNRMEIIDCWRERSSSKTPEMPCRVCTLVGFIPRTTQIWSRLWQTFQL